MDNVQNHNALKNRTILVTGASDGIGREAAITYARHGARVLLLGRNQEKLQTVANELAASGTTPASVIIFDLATATPERCHQLVKEISMLTPHLNGVLHNAGLLGEINAMATFDATIWQAVMQVNVNATFYLTQALLPLLLASPRASLILTSSSVGRQGRAGWGAYAVSKFATEGMMQVLAEEYAHSTLRINCINPGGTRTKMRASAFPEEDTSTLKTPAEIMPLYLWLMSDESSEQNGGSFDAQPKRQPGITK